MTTGRELDSYTIRFTARPWHETEFLHILCFLHFADNSQRPHEGEEYDWLWKLRTVFDKLNEAYAKLYNPSEHLAVDEVVVKFKGRVIFRQYIPKERKRFDIKIYKFCDESGYMYDMRVYLGRETHPPPLTTRLQHMQLLDIWLAELKA